MKSFLKGIPKEIGMIVLALLILGAYACLGFALFYLVEISLFTLLVDVPLYFVMGYLFFLLKVSKYKDIYGALEIVLGFFVVFIPLLMVLSDAQAESIKLITIYFAFYTGLYIQVRGYESIYRKWLSKSSKVNKDDFGSFSKIVCKTADKVSID